MASVSLFANYGTALLVLHPPITFGVCLVELQGFNNLTLDLQSVAKKALLFRAGMNWGGGVLVL